MLPHDYSFDSIKLYQNYYVKSTQNVYLYDLYSAARDGDNRVMYGYDHQSVPP